MSALYLNIDLGNGNYGANITQVKLILSYKVTVYCFRTVLADWYSYTAIASNKLLFKIILIIRSIETPLFWMLNRNAVYYTLSAFYYIPAKFHYIAYIYGDLAVYF